MQPTPQEEPILSGTHHEADLSEKAATFMGTGAGMRTLRGSQLKEWPQAGDYADIEHVPVYLHDHVVVTA